MIIDDRVYGRIEIKEPVLIDLIGSYPVQRLKGINQAGASQYAIKGKDVTRYEHSLGVMILLNKVNASLEEQIAGLLHDTPHTAFSHVIDFVFKSKNQDFHEKFHKEIITNSEIPAILKEYGFDVERLFDEFNFPLLEKSLPDLCADRIDYTLRDLVASYGFHDKINKYISSFIVKDNEIIIKEEKIAKEFAEDYLMMNETKWAHPLEITLFQILADAIKIALNSEVISQKDLFEDDAFLYDKLKESNNPEILNKLEMLNPNLEITNDPNDYDFYSKAKLRYINPKFIDSYDAVKQVTDVYPDFKAMLEKHNDTVENGNFIKIINY